MTFLDTELSRPRGSILGILGAFLIPFTQVGLFTPFYVSVGDIFVLLWITSTFFKPAAYDAGTGGLKIVLCVVAMAYLCAALLSAIANPAVPLADVAGFAVQHIVAFVLLPLALLRQNYMFVHRMMQAYLYGLASAIAVGAVLFFLFPSVAASLREAGFFVMVASGDATRVGFFAGVGELSKAVAFTLPMLYVLWRRRLLSPAASAVILGLLLLAIVLSRSGFGTMAFAITAGLLLVSHAVSGRKSSAPPSQKTMAASLLALVSGLSIGWLVGLPQAAGTQAGIQWQQFTGRLVDPIAERQDFAEIGSGNERLLLIQEGLATATESWLFGVGPGQFSKVSGSAVEIHLVPLQSVVEVGVVGLVGWGLLMGLYLLLGVRGLVDRRATGIALAASVLAMAVLQLSVPYAYGRIFVLPLTLILVAHVLDQPRANRSRTSSDLHKTSGVSA